MKFVYQLVGDGHLFGIGRYIDLDVIGEHFVSCIKVGMLSIVDSLNDFFVFDWRNNLNFIGRARNVVDSYDCLIRNRRGTVLGNKVGVAHAVANLGNDGQGQRLAFIAASVFDGSNNLVAVNGNNSVVAVHAWGAYDFKHIFQRVFKDHVLGTSRNDLRNRIGKFIRTGLEFDEFLLAVDFLFRIFARIIRRSYLYFVGGLGVVVNGNFCHIRNCSGTILGNKLFVGYVIANLGLDGQGDRFVAVGNNIRTNSSYHITFDLDFIGTLAVDGGFTHDFKHVFQHIVEASGLGIAWEGLAYRVGKYLVTRAKGKAQLAVDLLFWIATRLIWRGNRYGVGRTRLVINSNRSLVRYRCAAILSNKVGVGYFVADLCLDGKGYFLFTVGRRIFGCGRYLVAHNRNGIGGCAIDGGLAHYFEYAFKFVFESNGFGSRGNQLRNRVSKGFGTSLELVSLNAVNLLIGIARGRNRYRIGPLALAIDGYSCFIWNIRRTIFCNKVFVRNTFFNLGLNGQGYRLITVGNYVVARGGNLLAFNRNGIGSCTINGGFAYDFEYVFQHVFKGGRLCVTRELLANRVREGFGAVYQDNVVNTINLLLGFVTWLIGWGNFNNVGELRLVVDSNGCFVRYNGRFILGNKLIVRYFVANLGNDGQGSDCVFFNYWSFFATFCRCNNFVAINNNFGTVQIDSRRADYFKDTFEFVLKDDLGGASRDSLSHSVGEGFGALFKLNELCVAINLLLGVARRCNTDFVGVHCGLVVKANLCLIRNRSRAILFNKLFVGYAIANLCDDSESYNTTTCVGDNLIAVCVFGSCHNLVAVNNNFGTCKVDGCFDYLKNAFEFVFKDNFGSLGENLLRDRIGELLGAVLKLNSFFVVDFLFGCRRRGNKHFVRGLALAVNVYRSSVWNFGRAILFDKLLVGNTVANLGFDSERYYLGPDCLKGIIFEGGSNSLPVNRYACAFCVQARLPNDFKNVFERIREGGALGVCRDILLNRINEGFVAVGEFYRFGLTVYLLNGVFFRRRRSYFYLVCGLRIVVDGNDCLVRNSSRTILFD